VIPVLGGEAVEGQQGVAVLGQALDSSGVLGTILLLSKMSRARSAALIRRHPDLPQILPDRGLDGIRDLVENIGTFMKRASSENLNSRISGVSVWKRPGYMAHRRYNDETTRQNHREGFIAGTAPS
jgi:hypothetical protein